MRVQATVVILIAIASAAVGNVCLSEGMKAVGSLEAYDPASLWAFFTGACLNPWVMGGILLQLANYLMWMAVLSWSDVSWATPINAIEYVLVALAAAFFLGERVDPVRWLGIFLIVAGVGLMVGTWEPPADLLDVDSK